jgi:hypothetical protein
VGTVMILELVAAVVLLVLLVLALLTLRRIRILRRGGVDVALRAERPHDDAGGWHSGLGRYRGDEFRWYRVSGLRGGPNVVLDRTDLEIVDRRGPRAGEMHAPSATVLRCRTAAGTFELAMAPDAVTGFSSWLESTPPGRTGYRQAS